MYVLMGIKRDGLKGSDFSVVLCNGLCGFDIGSENRISGKIIDFG